MMPTPIETFVLVMKNPSDGTVQRVIRTYLSFQRAQEDRELMARHMPLAVFDVLTIDHIDN